MRIDKLADLLLSIGIAVRVLNRWSITEIEPDLAPRLAIEMKEKKASLYKETVAEIADFLKDEEGYTVLRDEQLFSYDRSSVINEDTPANG